MIGRKVSGVKLDSLANLHTDVQLDVLVDETLPGWSHLDEIKWLVGGGHVEGGLGARDHVEAGDDDHVDATTVDGDPAQAGGGGEDEVQVGDEGEEGDEDA
jgi:hypothetical protein